jgi:hypothetical protein
MAAETTFMGPSSYWLRNNYVHSGGLGEWDVRDDYQ